MDGVGIVHRDQNESRLFGERRQRVSDLTWSRSIKERLITRKKPANHIPTLPTRHRQGSISSSHAMDVIHSAISRGDLMKVKSLCEHEPDLLYLDDWQARTPLVLSVLANSLPLVKFFAEEVEEAARAMVDEPTAPDNNTALFYACRDGRVELASYLLARGADPWQRNRYGTTLFMITAASAPTGGGEGGGQCGGASATGVLLCLLEVINRSGEGGGRGRLHELLNARNRNGKTALALACERGASDVVVVLVAAGANPFLFPAAVCEEEGKKKEEEQGEAWECVYEARRAPARISFLEKIRCLADASHALEKLQEAEMTSGEGMRTSDGEGKEEEPEEHQQSQWQEGPKAQQKRTVKCLATFPLALQGRVAQDEEVPRVVLASKGDEKLLHVIRHVLIEGGLKPELFVELIEGMLVPTWHFEHM